MEPVSRDRLAPLVRDARERWSVPGLAVAVLADGRVTTAADGARVLGADEPVTPDTVFLIASITKSFVAALALTLVQDGLLELDAPPPGARVDASVRQLLSHQGGLEPEWPERLDPDDAADDAVLRVAKGRPGRLPVGPGELFSYCNVGFWLVAAAIARASGTTFEEAMRVRILEPLGLSSTGFEPPAPARGHDQVEPGADEHRVTEAAYPRVRRPGGGLWSTVGDLIRFAEHQLGGPGPLSTDSLVEMQRPQIRTGSYSYGLGWFLSEARGRRLVEHPGSALGYQSVLVLVPEERLAFAALSNSSRGLVAIRELRAELGLGVEELPDVTVPPSELAALGGRYAVRGIELVVVPDEGALRVELSEVDPFSGETKAYPSVRARPVGAREFEIVDGDWRGERLNFPREGFVCMGVLAARVE